MKILDRIIDEVKKGNLTKEEALQKFKEAQDYVNNYEQQKEELEHCLNILEGEK